LYACPPPLDVLEKKLGEALAKARGSRIKSPILEFWGDHGAAVALSEVVYF
jgi:hypothetical protein